MITKMFKMHALTAIHAGTGQGTGDIDLPIAREKSTGLPLVPGSSIKGVLREEMRPEDDAKEQALWETLFGPDNQKALSDAFSGALAIGDALVLCLPVRSVMGTFAWVTCPYVLERFRRDWLQIDGNAPFGRLGAPMQNDVSLAAQSGTLYANDKIVFLEDLDLQVTEDQTVKQMADVIGSYVFPNDTQWREYFSARFLVVPDAIFDFLAETATEIRARIRLEPQTRTVKKGALWYEENLPAETILWGIIGCDRSRNPVATEKAGTLMEKFCDILLPDGECRLQVGGNATVGRGQVRWLLAERS